MPLPTRRWLLGGAALALLAPLYPLWPGAVALMIALDAVWLLLAVADWRLGLRPGSVTVTRHAPPAFSVGHEVAVRYRWRSAADYQVLVWVRESWPAVLGGSPDNADRLLRLPAGTSLWETLPVVPVKRGRADGGKVYLRSLGPLGLLWKQVVVDLPWQLTVYPAIPPATRGAPLAPSRRRDLGRRRLSCPGEGRLFEALREWVPGDDTRVIDWKASARRGKLIARQYEDERRQRVLLVLDAGRLMTAEIAGQPRLEAAVAASLRLALAAVEHDDDVGLMVFASEVERFIPPSKGRRAVKNILDGLAATEGRMVEPDYPRAFRYLAARNRRRALTVIFTDLIDRTASDALVTYLATLKPRHLPLAVTIRDQSVERAAETASPDAAGAFRRAAAESLLGSRADTLAAMRRKGILVLDVAPDRAADAVVRQYELLKRRGAL